MTLYLLICAALIGATAASFALVAVGFVTGWAGAKLARVLRRRPNVVVVRELPRAVLNAAVPTKWRRDVMNRKGMN